MSNLDNLVAKIISDAEERAKAILASASAEADAVIREKAAEAEREVERILSNAESEATRLEEQTVLAKRLEIRDLKLKAKQDLIDRVFNTALDRLNNMPRDEFMAFLIKSLSSLEIDGHELLLPSKYGIIDPDEINDALKKAGKQGEVSLILDSERDISGGFVLSKNGIENNNTFEALIGFNRYSLENEIARELF